MIRILLVDDHPMLRYGTRMLLETQNDFSVVAETGSPHEAVQLAQSESADIALVDLELGRDQLDGAAVTRMILSARPETRVVAFTAFDSDSDIVRMTDAGAIGYVVKDSRPRQLFDAVRRASTGVAAMSAPIAQRLADRADRPNAVLTRRELEVIELAAAGLTNRELARELLVSEATVKTHLHHAFTKLGVDNRQAAIATAMKQGIVRL